MEDVREWVEVDRTMVCLKADAVFIEDLMRRDIRKSDFVDEDLDDMRTAVALVLDRDVGDRLFGHLSLA